LPATIEATVQARQPLPPLRQADSADARPADGVRIARRLRLAGHVQGVGFRPFVYRLAQDLGLSGTVQNLAGEVDILIDGAAAGVERFCREVITSAPPLARPQLIGVRAAACGPQRGFEILASAAAEGVSVFVPPDSFTCEDCLVELTDPGDRRYRYPFINCTQCGPRYTLIQALPYDRLNTTMAGFGLCEACRAEYLEPRDRRFHAEPVACAACGPAVWLEESAPGPTEGAPEAPSGEAALARAVAVLLAGGTVAVKGVGGYHLLCDATSNEAVARLRLRKRRPDKPLAVMFPQSGPQGLQRVRAEVELDEEEARLILSPARPAVLARRRAGTALAALVAPGLAEVAVFLPYSPLHHLLLGDVGRPLVATSGNLSGEPVVTDEASARKRLAPMVDACLHHDRPIARPADDSVMRCTRGRPRVLRLGRGLAPRELTLPWRLEHPVLATGGHLKTTIALAWENRVVISPHIGDMGTARSLGVFAQVVEDLQRLYAVRAAEVICDAHPDYATTRWAEASGLPVTRVLHHHAHASAVAGEGDPTSPMLVFAWDGAGFGEDGTLWGGETFLGAPGAWRRVASLRPFRLPGGDLAARAPWRSAAALCWEIGNEPPGPQVNPVIRAAWRAGVNCPSTSSVGRLFDAAAALVLGLRESTYEGQAPMLLEAAARGRGRAASRPWMPLPLRGDADGLTRLDWAPLLFSMLQTGQSVASRAAMVHGVLAASLLEVARGQRCACGVDRVGLAGGVFQNELLTELATDLLEAEGFDVCLAEQLPCNDGGLSYGQIIELAGRRQAKRPPC
jgi:hydrogenase maturation protein HypF